DSTVVIIITKARLEIDRSGVGRVVRIRWSTYVSGPPTVKILDVNNNLIQNITQAATEQFITIPNNSKWITITSTTDYVYEIGLSNEPTFNITNGYMRLHADAAKEIRKPYQMANITYFPTSVERLYKIGETGVWQSYQDKPIWVDQGETIYAKGVDKHGNETRIISQHTANVSDSLSPLVFDRDDSTMVRSMTNARLEIDSSVIGKVIRIRWSTYVSGPPTLRFLDVDNNLIQSITQTSTEQFITIPNNSKWITITSTTDYVYEISLSNEPTFSALNGYMLIHSDSTKSINDPYQLITINYFPSSVERLYKIGETGVWESYQDKPVLVNQGKIIYAKGVDKYGNETRIISQYNVDMVDALGALAYDGNSATFESANGTKKVLIDSGLYGKKISITTSRDCGTASCVISVSIISVDGTTMTSYTLGNGTISIDVPANAKYLQFGMSRSKVYEITPLS
ncbi:MAG: hypothetical protein PHO63_06690, partial [Bacilli bacterium]|nr:hypothetical protein [Bacilli bacterium]